MALSGTFYGTTANENIKPKIVWSATQSVSGNYSDVTATLCYSRTNTGYTTEGNWTGTLSIGGNTASVTGLHLKITYNADAVAITHTARVQHKADGTCTVTVSATGSISGTTLTSTAISADLTPDAIPRHTQIADATGKIGQKATLVLTKKSSAFYHSLRYKNPCNGRYYYIDANGDSVLAETLLSAATVPFHVPELYLAIPDSKSGTFTIECWTYPENNAAVWLADCTTATFTYTTDEVLCAPSVWASVKDTNPVCTAITGDSNVLVRHMSNARLQVGIAARNGATVTDFGKNVSVKVGDRWYYDEDLTFDFPEVEQSDFSLWVKDTRGYENYGKAHAASIVPYVKLTSNPSAKRQDQTGSIVVLTFAGTYYSGDIHKTPNTLQLKYQLQGQSDWTQVLPDDPSVSWSVDESNSTYHVEVTLQDLAYTRTFTVQTCVRDIFGQQDESYDLYKTVIIPAGYPVFDWGENDFRFNVPVELPSLTIGGVSLENYIKKVMGG